MGLWDKIWEGIKTFGKGLYAGFQGAITGGTVGMVAGPIGIAVGILGGAIAGISTQLPNMIDYIDRMEEPDAKSIVDRASGGQTSAAISYAAANPDDPASQVVLKTLTGVQAGGTWRSSWIAAGGHQFGRALGEGGIQSVVNKAAGELGVHPMTAMAHGNGAFRSMLSSAGGQSASGHEAVANHIRGAALQVAGSALVTSGTRGLIYDTPTKSGASSSGGVTASGFST